jgi:predicted amidohydrolase YtcJ
MSARGKIQIPLLRDRHTHPFLYASWIDGINIHDASSKQDALKRIKAQEVSDGEILIVQGWLDSKFQFVAEDLKSFGPTAVFNLSLHGLVMNDQAKTMIESELGMTGQWKDQVWFERNLRRILNAFAILNGNVDRLKRYFDWLRTKHGVIYAEEMLLAGEKEIEVFREAELLDRTRFWCSWEMWQTLSQPSQNLIRGMKIFADGALGVRTAAVKAAYDTGDNGMLMYSDEELEKLFIDCVETERAIAIHAIGDRAIDQVVELVHRQRIASGFENEVRIEHAQLISLESARQAKETGIILSMQPNFSVDSIEYLDRLPNQYLVGNNPFRMLIDEVGFVPGEDLIFGSDGMPHGATEAIRQSLTPPYPKQQALTVDELVAGYCDRSVFANDEMIEVALD